MARVIGIDLGTSNSAAAVMEGPRPAMIPSAEGTSVGGGKAFPSYVAFTQDGQRFARAVAKSPVMRVGKRDPQVFEKGIEIPRVSSAAVETASNPM